MSERTVIDMPTPSGTTTFCDDVRQEVGGKRSEIGIYSADLIVGGNLPTNLPKLCCVISFRMREADMFDLVGDLLFRVIFVEDADDEDGTTLAEMKINIEQTASGDAAKLKADDKSGVITEANVIMTMTPFAIRSEGWLKARAVTETKMWKLGALRITSQPVENGGKPASPAKKQDKARPKKK